MSFGSFRSFRLFHFDFFSLCFSPVNMFPISQWHLTRSLVWGLTLLYSDHFRFDFPDHSIAGLHAYDWSYRYTLTAYISLGVDFSFSVSSLVSTFIISVSPPLSLSLHQIRLKSVTLTFPVQIFQVFSFRSTVVVRYENCIPTQHIHRCNIEIADISRLIGIENVYITCCTLRGCTTNANLFLLLMRVLSLHHMNCCASNGFELNQDLQHLEKNSTVFVIIVVIVVSRVETNEWMKEEKKTMENFSTLFEYGSLLNVRHSGVPCPRRKHSQGFVSTRFARIDFVFSVDFFLPLSHSVSHSFDQPIHWY